MNVFPLAVIVMCLQYRRTYRANPLLTHLVKIIKYFKVVVYSKICYSAHTLSLSARQMLHLPYIVIASEQESQFLILCAAKRPVNR